MHVPRATPIASAAPAARAASRSLGSTPTTTARSGSTSSSSKARRDELLGVRAGDDDVEAIGDPGQLERGCDALARGQHARSACPRCAAGRSTRSTRAAAARRHSRGRRPPPPARRSPRRRRRGRCACAARRAPWRPGAGRPAVGLAGRSRSLARHDVDAEHDGAGDGQHAGAGDARRGRSTPPRGARRRSWERSDATTREPADRAARRCRTRPTRTRPPAACPSRRSRRRSCRHRLRVVAGPNAGCSETVSSGSTGWARLARHSRNAPMTIATLTTIAADDAAAEQLDDRVDDRRRRRPPTAA